MSDIAVALSRLPQALRDKVSVQFVSTDPHRDTPARLRHWVEAYSPSFHAGRAPIGQVIELRPGVRHLHQPAQGDQG